VTVSGWFVALLVLGSVPVVLLGGVPGLIGWLAFVVVVTGLDLLLAGSPRTLRF
jgi:hypothetical protein